MPNNALPTKFILARYTFPTEEHSIRNAIRHLVEKQFTHYFLKVSSFVPWRRLGDESQLARNHFEVLPYLEELARGLRARLRPGRAEPT